MNEKGREDFRAINDSGLGWEDGEIVPRHLQRHQIKMLLQTIVSMYAQMQIF